MKYAMKKPLFVSIILITMTVVEVAFVIYLALKLAGVLSDNSSNLIVDISNLALFAIAIVFTSLLLNIHYTITDKSLKLRLAWFDLLANKVSISRIVNIVYKKDQSKVYISYICEQSDPVIVHINIESKRIESFVNTLKAHNPRIVYIEEE